MRLRVTHVVQIHSSGRVVEATGASGKTLNRLRVMQPTTRYFRRYGFRSSGFAHLLKKVVI